ncbi:MAG: SMC family ATPase [Saccharofermentans sp.]|nr:SMC family ATPase [Saccharofermentans sp.]
MKPIKLEMQAFGAFAKHTVIDFAKLNEAQMFLIRGATGSGKTTIFDAMMLALYGASSGEEAKKVGRNDFESWRCTKSKWDVETFVSFDFEVSGKLYHFKRSLIPKRKNLDKGYEAGEIVNGVLDSFFDKPTAELLNSKAEEIIGLTRDQFRQVVLLPQGQFETFLTSSTDEKDKILTKIFGCDIWDKYAERMYNNAEKVVNQLASEKKTADDLLGNEKDSEGNAITDPESLASYIEELKAELQANEDAHKAFNAEARQKQLNSDIELFAKFENLHELEDKAASYKKSEGNIKAAGKILDLANRAEPFRKRMSDLDKAQREQMKRAEGLKDIEELIPKASLELDKAKAELEKVSSSTRVENNNKRIGQLQDKRKTYEEIDSLKAELDKVSGIYAKADAEFKTCKSKSKEADEAVVSKNTALSEATAKAALVRTKYLEGICGELATELAEDKPCPVCGSLHHPSPAVRLESSVSKEDMEKAEEDAKSCKTLFDKALQAKDAADKELSAKQSAVNASLEQLNEAKASYGAALKNLIEGIDDLKMLEDQISMLTEDNKEFEALVKKLEGEASKKQEALTSLIAKKTQAEAEYKVAKAAYSDCSIALDKAIAESDFDSSDEVSLALKTPEEMQALTQKITSYETAVKENLEGITRAKSELEGKIEPDKNLFDSRQEEISSESEKYNKTKSVLDGNISRLTVLYSSVSKTLEHYNANINQAQADLKFARLVRGDTGIGLKRYILAIKFDQIVNSANEMLKKMHGGRYQLVRTDDKGEGRKRGLEFKVRDSEALQEGLRSVRMLSGGEKFLVSLALSIGMSTIAKRSGAKIESLFIDEGFGTLDADSVCEAMSTLESVKSGSGTIGIISHVEMLTAFVPRILEVVSKPDGSYIL